MDSMILFLSFASAIAIAACVVFFFSRPIGEALDRVIPAELAAAWRQYAKFALFVVTFAGGLRVSELSAFVASRAAPMSQPLTAGQSLLEVLKSITGSLIAAAVALLAFFAVTLAIEASRRLYAARRVEAERAAAQRARSSERPPERSPQAPAQRPAQPAPAHSSQERRPVGAERHAGVKERRGGEEPGRFL